MNVYQSTIYRWRVEHSETCRYCGQQFQTRQRFGPRQRPACSDACREALRRDYIERKLARRRERAA